VLHELFRPLRQQADFPPEHSSALSAVSAAVRAFHVVSELDAAVPVAAPLPSFHPLLSGAHPAPAPKLHVLSRGGVRAAAMHLQPRVPSPPSSPSLPGSQSVSERCLDNDDSPTIGCAMAAPAPSPPAEVEAERQQAKAPSQPLSPTTLEALFGIGGTSKRAVASARKPRPPAALMPWDAAPSPAPTAAPIAAPAPVSARVAPPPALQVPGIDSGFPVASAAASPMVDLLDSSFPAPPNEEGEHGAAAAGHPAAVAFHIDWGRELRLATESPPALADAEAEQREDELAREQLAPADGSVLPPVQSTQEQPLPSLFSAQSQPDKEELQHLSVQQHVLWTPADTVAPDSVSGAECAALVHVATPPPPPTAAALAAAALLREQEPLFVRQRRERMRQEQQQQLQQQQEPERQECVQHSNSAASGEHAEATAAQPPPSKQEQAAPVEAAGNDVPIAPPLVLLAGSPPPLLPGPVSPESPRRSPASNRTAPFSSSRPLSAKRHPVPVSGAEADVSDLDVALLPIDRTPPPVPAFGGAASARRGGKRTPHTVAATAETELVKAPLFHVRPHSARRRIPNIWR